MLLENGKRNKGINTLGFVKCFVNVSAHRARFRAPLTRPHAAWLHARCETLYSVWPVSLLACLSVCLSVCLLVCLLACLLACLSVCLFVSLLACLSVC